MNLTADSTLAEIGLTLSGFALVCLLTWLAFVSGESLVGFLDQNAIKVVSRLMGLLLTVIGAQMLIEGVAGAVAAAAGARPAP